MSVWTRLAPPEAIGVDKKTGAAIQRPLASGESELESNR